MLSTELCASTWPLMLIMDCFNVLLACSRIAVLFEHSVPALLLFLQKLRCCIVTLL